MLSGAAARLPPVEQLRFLGAEGAKMKAKYQCTNLSANFSCLKRGIDRLNVLNSIVATLSPITFDGGDIELVYPADSIELPHLGDVFEIEVTPCAK